MAQQAVRTRPYTANIEDLVVEDEGVPVDELTVEPLEPLPAAASAGMLPQSTPEGDPGYFEDRGMAGGIWHAPTGSGSDATRPDASILGVPPELAITSPLAIGRAALGGGAMAGAKTAISQAAPALKYEVAKTGLESLGLPPSLATVVALGVSGYQRGAKPRAKPAPKAAKPAPAQTPAPASAPARTTTEQVQALKQQHVQQHVDEMARIRGTSADIPDNPTARAIEAGRTRASAAAPSSSLPVTPATPTAASARISGPGSSAESQSWSPQRIRNEVGLASRRSGLKLTDKQMEQADALVARGLAPAKAVQEVAVGRATAAKPHITAAESAEYTRLRRMGKSHEEARQALEAQRALAQQMGTPSPETVRRRVVERNATGRWSTDK